MFLVSLLLTSFVGDGSQLTGVSGFTLLSNDSTSLLNRIFKTPKQLDLTAGTFLRVVSDTPSGDIAFDERGCHSCCRCNLPGWSSDNINYQCSWCILINKHSKRILETNV